MSPLLSASHHARASLEGGTQAMAAADGDSVSTYTCTEGKKKKTPSPCELPSPFIRRVRGNYDVDAEIRAAGGGDTC